MKRILSNLWVQYRKALLMAPFFSLLFIAAAAADRGADSQDAFQIRQDSVTLDSVDRGDDSELKFDFGDGVVIDAGDSATFTLTGPVPEDTGSGDGNSIDLGEIEIEPIGEDVKIEGIQLEVVADPPTEPHVMVPIDGDGLVIPEGTEVKIDIKIDIPAETDTDDIKVEFDSPEDPVEVRPGDGEVKVGAIEIEPGGDEDVQVQSITLQTETGETAATGETSSDGQTVTFQPDSPIVIQGGDRATFTVKADIR